jgi:hypothetical protein
MSKRPSLFKIPTAATAAIDDEQEAAAFAGSESEAGTSGMKGPAKRPPSREGKRIFSIYLDPLAWKQLRMLALETDTTAQALGEEAINLLFAKHHINRSA